MSKDSLSLQWGRLADRFRRIADHECSDVDVTAAAAQCGRLFHECKAAGLFPTISLPPRRVPTNPSDDDSHMMATIWFGLATALGGNPAHLQWERRDPGGDAEGLFVGGTKAAHWRIRAENYAAVCDELAAELRQEPPALQRAAGAAAAFEAFAGPELAKIMAIRNGSSSVDDKLRAICGIDRRFLSWSSSEWVIPLDVTRQAIEKTKFWKVDRPRLIEELDD